MSIIKFPRERAQERQIDTIRVKEEEDAAREFAERLGLPYLSLTFKSAQRSALEIVPEVDARKANLAVIRKKGGSLAVVLRDPKNPYADKILGDLKRKFEEVSLFITSSHDLEKAWSGYGVSATKKKISGEVAISPDILREFREETNSIKDLKEIIERVVSQKNASIIAELLLAGALALDASDIHIEPSEKNIRLRLRIDGLMRDITNFDDHIYKLLLSRIKLLSEMKLNIHNSAQDGRFSVAFEDFEVQIRASVLPGEYGENIVMRVLNPDSLLSVERLGIREDLLRVVEKQILKPNGMILTTGPTGSGKTTTLYAFLRKLQTPEVKIVTIEDPIEYHLEGISQTQIDPERGYTFETGLKSVLRQDPDIILVGEIRDFETANTALQASLTGHLLLSTLHTNDAAGVVPRLVDIGAKPSVIGPALNMAIAQRLLRRICGECSVLRDATEEEIKIFEGVSPNSSSGLKIPQARGCDKCADTGYKGRVGVFEIIVNTPELERFILSEPSITEIREYLLANGMVTLKQDGLLKVLEGVTTIEEVKRVIGL